MKVLHVITGLDTGGAEAQLAAMVTTMRPNRPDQRVVSLLPTGVVGDGLMAAGIPVDSLRMGRRGIDPRGIGRLVGIIRAFRPDAIQTWMYHADLVATLALLLSGGRRGTRLFWGVRCSDMDTRHYGARLRMVIRLCARLSPLAGAIVANSEAGRRVHEDLGYRPRRFLVIANGIDCARYRPDPRLRIAMRAELGIDAEMPLLAHVARVDPMKDHDTLLAALDRLPGVAVLCVGSGTEALPDRPSLLRLGRRTDLPRLYAAADLVISSSAFGEGFSNALAEGMAAGLPAVATDVGDARRIIGDAGRVVPPREPDALAAAVRDLLARPPEERTALAVAARARIVGAFSLARAVAAFDALHRGEDPMACAA